MYLDLYSQGLTQGAIAHFLNCPRRFELYFMKGIRNPKVFTYYMDFGTVVHDVKAFVNETWWSLKCQNDPSSAYDVFDFEHYLSLGAKKIHRRLSDAILLHEEFSALQKDNELKILEGIFRQTSMLMQQYYQFWKKDFTSTKWMGIENTFSIGVKTRRGNIVPIRGKYDGLFSTEKGTPVLFETKTKGKFTDDQIFNLIEMDLQIKVYTYAIYKQYDIMPGGVLYNVIRRPQLKQKVSEKTSEFYNRILEDIIERPEHYFCRYPGVIEKSEILSFEKDLQDIVSEIEDLYLEHRQSYKNFKSCVSDIGYSCQYVEYCHNNNQRLLVPRHSEPYPELLPIADDNNAKTI